jgi:glutamate racemase
MGENVHLIDSGGAVARTVAEGLRRLGIANPDDATPEHHFCVTDSSARFGRIAQRILGAADLSLEWVDVF